MCDMTHPQTHPTNSLTNSLLQSEIPCLRHTPRCRYVTCLIHELILTHSQTHSTNSLTNSLSQSEIPCLRHTPRSRYVTCLIHELLLTHSQTLSRTVSQGELPCQCLLIHSISVKGLTSSHTKSLTNCLSGRGTVRDNGC